jgi:uncharacterized protein (DUF4415 family)
MKHKNQSNKKLTAKQRKELTKLKAMPDSSIDTSDLPEVVFSKKARRGLFYRPRKASITIRIDQDVLDYYRAHAADGRYQTEINNALRQQMEERAD